MLLRNTVYVVVVQVFTDAANRVSRHHAFRAVKIEKAHFCVGSFTFFDKHKRIRSDAAVLSVAEAHRKSRRIVDFLRHRINYDKVVAGRFHFAELHSLFGLPQAVYVDKLNVFGGIFAFKAVCDSVRRVKRGQTRNIALNGVAAHTHGVGERVSAFRGSRNYIVDFSRIKEREQIGVGIFVDFVDDRNVHAEIADYFRRAFRRVERKSHVEEFFCKVGDFVLVAFPHGYQHTARTLHVVARRNQSLKNRFFHRGRNA